MAIGKTIPLDNYLVRVGFSADVTGLNQFLELLGKGKKAIQESAPSIGKSLIGATAAYVGFVSKAAIGIAGLVNQIADADRNLAIESRKMWMNKSAFTEMSYAAEALGYSMDELNEVALNPELTRQFYELLDVSKKLQPSKEALESLKLVRETNLEVQKLSMIGKYALYNFGAMLAEFLGEDVSELRNDFEEINNEIAQNLKPNLEKVVKIVGPIVREMKDTLWPIIRGGIQFLSNFLDKLSANEDAGKNYIALINALLILLSVASKNPLGIMLVAAQYLLKLLSKYAEKEGNIEKISNLFVKIASILSKVGSIVGDLFEVAEPLLDIVIELIDVVLDAVEPILTIISSIVDWVQKLIDAIKWFFGAKDKKVFGEDKSSKDNSGLSEELSKIFGSKSFYKDVEKSVVNNSTNTKTQNVNITNNNSIYGSNDNADAIGKSIGNVTEVAANRALAPATY